MRRWLWIGILAALLAFAGAEATPGVGGSGATRATKKADYYTFPYSGDNTGIQEALNYANPGGVVQLGAMRVAITSTLTVPTGVTLAGMGDSTVLYAAANDTIFNVWGNNAVIRNLRIDGQKGARTSGQGIIVTGDSVRIEGVTISDTYDAAIHIHMGADAPIIEKCRIRSPGGGSSTDGNGIIIHDANGAKVLNNSVYGAKKWGIWLQNTAERALVMGNHVEASGNDGIHTDAGCKLANILGNTVKQAENNGINVTGDSTNVSNNVVTAAKEFGIWSANGGSGGAWWNNILEQNGNYNMGIEMTAANDTIAGWAIFSNFMMHPHGQNFEIQCSAGGGFIRDVQFANNYMIQTDVPNGLAGPPHPSVKIVANSAGSVERISYIGNVIKDSKRDGFQFDVSGPGHATDVIVTGNHILNSAYWGLRTIGGGVGSTCFISDNYYKGNGSGPESLSTAAWTYEGIGGQIKSHATIGVFEDSLRVGRSNSSNPTSTLNGDVLLGQDLKLNNNKSLQWKDNGGTYQRYVVLDSVNNLVLRPRTGGNVDVYTTGGVLGTRFYGTGGISITAGGTLQLGGFNFLKDASPNRRIVNLNAGGLLTFRDAADAQDNLTLNDAGTSLDMPQTSAAFKLGGNVAMKNVSSVLQLRPLGSGTKITVRDWADANDNLYINDGGSMELLRGRAIFDKDASVADSLVVLRGRAQFGPHAGGTADTVVIGRPTFLRKYGAAGDFIISNTGQLLEFTFGGNNILRASDAAGYFRFDCNGTNERFRIENNLVQSKVQFKHNAFQTVASATSVDLSVAGPQSNCIAFSGSTTITGATVPAAGTVLYLKLSAGLQISDGNAWKIAGNMVDDNTGDLDTITVVSDGSNLFELSRSHN